MLCFVFPVFAFRLLLWPALSVLISLLLTGTLSSRSIARNVGASATAEATPDASNNTTVTTATAEVTTPVTPVTPQNGSVSSPLERLDNLIKVTREPVALSNRNLTRGPPHAGDPSVKKKNMIVSKLTDVSKQTVGFTVSNNKLKYRVYCRVRGWRRESARPPPQLPTFRRPSTRRRSSLTSPSKVRLVTDALCSLD